MGDKLRGENLVHLNVRFSTETELKKIQDFLYEKSGQGVSFTGLVEAMANEVTIVTAVHNIKSNKGSKTAAAFVGLDIVDGGYIGQDHTGVRAYHYRADL